MNRRLLDALAVAAVLLALVAFAWIAADLQIVEPPELVP